MSWSFIGANHSPTDTDNTLARSVTAGDLLYVFAESNTPGDTLTISDSVNTWFLVGSKFNDNGNNNAGFRWCAKAATTASITVTISGATQMESLAIVQWRSSVGIPADPRDVSAQTADPNHVGSTTTDADVVPNATPAAAGELQVSVIADVTIGGSGAADFNAGTGFTKRDEEFGLGRNQFAIQDKLSAGAGSQDAHWTGLTTDSYFASNDFFKELAAAGHKLLKMGVK